MVKALEVMSVEDVVSGGESAPEDAEGGPEALRHKVEKRIGCKLTEVKGPTHHKFEGSIFKLVPNERSSKCFCHLKPCMCPSLFDFGSAKWAKAPAKYMLLVGQTGSGKTTFLNAVANALCKVEFDDDYRLEAVSDEQGGASQAHSQTQKITMYTFFPCENCDVDFPLSIFDTMGFADTRGLDMDKKVVESISVALGSHAGDVEPVTGILHAICLVHNAGTARLTGAQKYIFEAILSLFGKDMAPAVVPLFTFGDSNLQPQGLAAFHEAGIQVSKYFSLNNGHLYGDNFAAKLGAAQKSEAKKVKRNRDSACFQFEDSMNACYELCESLATNHPISLQQTRDVMKIRQRLEVVMCATLRKVEESLASLNALQHNLTQMATTLSVIGDTEGKRYISKKVEIVDRNLVPDGQHVTLCADCVYTCHEVCCITQNDQKDNCAVMNNCGYCTVCPQRCHWRRHYNDRIHFVHRVEIQEVEVAEVMKQYNVSIKDKDACAKTLRKMMGEFRHKQSKLAENLVTVHFCLQKLEKLALRQYPLSVVQYIDMLIKAENISRRPGFEDRVRSLDTSKKMVGIAVGTLDNVDPLQSSLDEFSRMAQEVLGKNDDALLQEISVQSTTIIRHEHSKRNAFMGILGQAAEWTRKMLLQ